MENSQVNSEDNTGCWKDEKMCNCSKFGSAPVQDAFIVAKPWNETEEGKEQLLDIVNSLFLFEKDGTICCRECKNESVACVCIEIDNV